MYTSIEIDIWLEEGDIPQKNSDALTVQYQRLCATQRFIFFILRNIDTELPLEITSESSLHDFKNKTKEFFMYSHYTVQNEFKFNFLFDL